MVIASKDQEYSICDYSRLSDLPRIDFGVAYNLYLNKDGEVVWLETSSSSATNESLANESAAILTDVGNNGTVLAEDYAIRVYGESGKAVTLSVGEKVKFNGNSEKTKSILTSIQAAIGNPILYKLNKDGAVSEIVTAVDYGVGGDRGWYRINPTVLAQQPTAWTESEWSTYKSKYWYMYGANGNDLGKFFYYNTATKMYTVPTNADDYGNEKNFSVNMVSFGDNQLYALEGFSRDKNAIEAEVLVLRQAATSGGMVQQRQAFVIEKVVAAMDDEGNIIKKVRGYRIDSNNTMQYASIGVANEVVMVDDADPGVQISPAGDINTVGPRTFDELRPGDIIRYGVNSQGLIDVIRTNYDCDTGKSFQALSGSGSVRVGDAILTNGNNVRIATTIKPENINYTDIDQARTTQAYRLTNSNAILIVESVNDRVIMRKGSINDITTYKDTNTPNKYDKVVVITYWTSLNLGAVIYKN
jgi:hypothetical protein